MSAKPIGAGSPAPQSMMSVDARRGPSTNDDEVDTEEPWTTPSKRATTVMGLKICVLEAMDDVFDPILVHLARTLL